MPLLEFITVEGFKSVKSIERLPLGPINVVIGANGSGKSNFIQVFSFLRAICVGRLQYYVQSAGGANRILHFGLKKTKQVTVQLRFRHDVSYGITLSASDVGGLFPAREVVRFWDDTDVPQPREGLLMPKLGEAGISYSEDDAGGVEDFIRDHLMRWRLYHFHDTSSSSPMKQEADVHDNWSLLPDGRNLPAFLHLLRERHGSAYGLIRRTVGRVAPFFDDFVLRPTAENPNMMRLGWRHKGSDDHFDVSSLSDGTLRFIALATLLLQPESLRPPVILLDEPELGLHPYAITLLASLVRQASVNTQLVLATQSPLLLDHFEPEDVLVADRAGGETRLSRLDSTSLKTWLDDYSLGQLWEKNELGGRPGRDWNP